MESYSTRNKNDEKIKACGEAVWTDFNSFRNDIHRINAEIFPLIQLLGLDDSDKDAIIETMINSINISLYKNLKKTFVECIMKKVKEGSIRIERILPKDSLTPKDETPEKRERRLKGRMSRALNLSYNSILKSFLEDYPNSSTYYNKSGLIYFGQSLDLTEEGFFIDRDKFLFLYENYWEAQKGETYHLHKEAAHGINLFFGPSIPVTKKELEKYFIIKNGRVEPNLESVNKESYLRLGIKGKAKKKRKKQ